MTPFPDTPTYRCGRCGRLAPLAPDDEPPAVCWWCGQDLCPACAEAAGQCGHVGVNPVKGPTSH